MAKKKPGKEMPELGNYTNFLAVNYNVSEVCLDFGQKVPNSEIVAMHTRLITSPQHLKGMADHMLKVFNEITLRAKQTRDKSDDGQSKRG